LAAPSASLPWVKGKSGVVAGAAAGVAAAGLLEDASGACAALKRGAEHSSVPVMAASPIQATLRLCGMSSFRLRSAMRGRRIVHYRRASALLPLESVKQPLTEVRGFILRSKQTLQNSPNMPELYTRAEAPGPTYFLVRLHRLLDRAERVNVLPFFPTGRLAPTIPRYSAVPPCVDRDTRDGQDCSAIPPLTE